MSPSLEKGSVKRLALLEASLYSAGRPVELEELKLVLKTRSGKVVLKLVEELDKKYKARRSALEIKELHGKRIILRLKQEYKNMVIKITKKPLMTSGPLKTLSYIAYNQPVDQMKVIADRGSHAYAHLRMIEEMGLITRENSKSKGVIISTTPYFSDYFGLSNSPLKTKIQLRRMFDLIKITKLDNGDGDGGEEQVNHRPLLSPTETLSNAEYELPKEFNEYLSAIIYSSN
jgi:segregation and condensation protein B